MRIGLMADSHDNLQAIRYLIAYFKQQRVERIIHAGDFVSPFTVPELNQFEGPIRGVFGNNDGDRETLLEKARETRLEIHRAPHRMEWDSTRFLISHRPEDVPETIPDEVDVVVHGHTHQRRIERRSEHLILNPGEAGGWLTGAIHALVLDTEAGDVDSHVAPSR